MNIFNTRGKSKSSLKMLPFVIDTNVSFFLILLKYIADQTNHVCIQSMPNSPLNTSLPYINFFAYCFNEQKVHTSFDVIS